MRTYTVLAAHDKIMTLYTKHLTLDTKRAISILYFGLQPHAQLVRASAGLRGSGKRWIRARKRRRDE